METAGKTPAEALPAWEDIGIVWKQLPVRKQAGDHATDREQYNTLAEIPVVEDLDAFRLHFGDEVVLGILDGTSVRVSAQDVNRRALEKGIKGANDRRMLVYNRLRGIRTQTRGTTVVEVKVRFLPNGQEYKGTDEVEFRQQFVEALVDMGVPANVAIERSNEVTF